MAHSTGTITDGRYATTIEADGHVLIADEPVSNGGADMGPDPYGLLLAGLSACTAITLRMYADHKKWPMSKLTVDVHFARDAEKNERIDRTLHIEGALSEEQRARIADIAERTPVTLTLKRGLPIVTTLAPAS